MRADNTIDLDGRAVTIHELTVGDIRAWLKRLETLPSPQVGGAGGEVAPFDLVGVALIDGCDLADLAPLTDLTPEAVETLTPGQIRRVFDVAREVNADFFAMREQLADLARAALATPAAP